MGMLTSHDCNCQWPAGLHPGAHRARVMVGNLANGGRDF